MSTEKQKKKAYYMREYNRKDPSYNRAHVKAWRAANPDKFAKQKERELSYQAKRRRANPEHHRAIDRKCDLKRHYGITVADYDFMFASQGGVCAICKLTCPSGRRLAVDHNHDTGKVRGLLCGPCNQMLAKLEATPNWVKQANFYLEVHMAKNESGSGKSIYGENPDGKVDSIVSDALKSCGESKSNKINGPIGNKGEWSDMGEGEGEN